MTPAELLILAALGLVAGIVGGLVGVGGSVVIIPVLTIVLHRNQHLSQATAMIINVFVAAAAVIRHRRAGAVRFEIVSRMLPFGLLFILVGVEASNHLDSGMLKRVYAVFLLYVIAINVARLFAREHAGDEPARVRGGWLPLGATGGAMGLAAGLLGIGGGPVAIPLLQRICHLPLRQAIASTSAVMCVTALIGAARKNLTLSGLTDPSGEPLGLGVGDSLLLAAGLAPTAVIGALIGASLTHTLPVRWVRLAFILLMIWASWNMFDLL